MNNNFLIDPRAFYCYSEIQNGKQFTELNYVKDAFEMNVFIVDRSWTQIAKELTHLLNKFQILFSCNRPRVGVAYIAVNWVTECHWPYLSCEVVCIMYRVLKIECGFIPIERLPVKNRWVNDHIIQVNKYNRWLHNVILSLYWYEMILY